MRIPALLLLLFTVSMTGADTTHADKAFKIYLVRHAEKQVDGGEDPGLTDAGKHRAHQLANWFQHGGIKKIWSSDYHRTRDTAIPFAASQDLRITLYDPRDLKALASELSVDRINALVVGHSNTTPDLTRLLCQCDISDMDESEYDLLFVVTISGGDTQVEVLDQSTLFEPWPGKE